MTGKTYHCSIRVRGYEIDSFGHVNNAVYLNYLEVARWQMLEEEGITLPWIQREQRWPVISSIAIKYHKPCFMSEELTVKTAVTENGRVRFKIHQTIHKGDELAASAEIESVIVDAKGRPAAIPEAYQRLWGENV